MEFSQAQIKRETNRLYVKLQKLGWTKKECEIYAPLTLEINKLKKEQNAIVLAHSYLTPDIVYGVADFVGDSYYLSEIATKNKAKKIIFASVYFMAETAKILNPEKEVLVPTVAGCSLAESINTKDLAELKKKYPKAKVVCYINTSAEIKAKSDICCTSANALKIINSIPEKEIILIPDEYMAKNIAKMTDKKIISSRGRCIVHEKFSEKVVKEIKKEYPRAKILSHIECSPKVIAESDLAGSTSDIINYIKKDKGDTYMIVTECGISDRIKVEFKGKKIVGSCSLCPYMKKINIKDILQVLKTPQKNQIVKLSPVVLKNAKKSLDRMMEISKN